MHVKKQTKAHGLERVKVGKWKEFCVVKKLKKLWMSILIGDKYSIEMKQENRQERAKYA